VRQAAFHSLEDVTEVFYGGAAGGGKSDALLAAALRYVHEPKYAAIIFRRTYTDLSLPGALMPRAHEWLQGTDARWSEGTKTWHFPSGATLSFGYLDSENDKFRYQSSEFQFVGYDELTQFSLGMYSYLFSRLRRLKGSNVPLRMRSASNPGGVGHEWVKQRFITGSRPDRIFVRARMEDNPFLDQEEYRLMLDNLDPVTRAQLLLGDWDVVLEGNLFKQLWFPIIKRREIPEKMVQVVRFWDLAATLEKPGTDPDYTAGCLMGKDVHNSLYVLDMQRERGTPMTIENLIKQTALDDRELFGDVSTTVEQEGGASGVFTIDNFVRKVLFGFDAKGQRAVSSKWHRAKPLSAQVNRGNVSVVEAGWNYDFFMEICAFPNPHIHDDQVDAMSGAFSQLATGNRWGAN